MEIKPYDESRLEIEGNYCTKESFGVLLDKIKNGFNFLPEICKLKVKLDDDQELFLE